MDENRSLKRMNWEFNNYHKFAKCYCASKNFCSGYYSDIDHHVDEEESYTIKYYNSPQYEKTYKKKEQAKKQCDSCICHHLEYFKPGTLVDVYLSNGCQFLSIYFIYLDSQSCCGYFLQIDDQAVPVMIDCRQIDAIRKACSAS
ncbi:MULTISPECIES: hypothetical protein [unclassified Lysinibacillus]|uniref:hypothetical protein n=1 Tax=unclassified Lysinibacillus TaxID=2636778 RepID=UPI0030FA0166